MAKANKRKQSLDKSLAVLRGNEPKVTKDNYKVDLICALNWHNVNWEEKDYRKAALEYIKKMNMKQYTHAINKADFLEIRNIGSIGRLVLTGQYVDLNDIEKIAIRLEDLKAKYPNTTPVKAKTVTTVPVSIQERIMEQARTLGGDFEGAVDEFLAGGKEDFSAKSYLLTNQVSGAVAKKIGEMFKPIAAELAEAVAGKDAQLKEAYSNVPKSKLKKLAAFVQSFVDDCLQQTVSAKAQRKPRARKVKPPSVLVKKVKYLKEFAELKLKSISAEKIIGASELWTYNPSTRKLAVFYGADNGVLGVSGMSITNYDVNKSEVKTLRKPEEFFKGLTSTGKRAMANAWKAVKAKTSKPRARINEEVILLAAN